MEVTDVDKELKNIRRKFNRNKGNARLMAKYIGQLQALIDRNTADMTARKEEITSLQAQLEASQPTLRHNYHYDDYERSFFKRLHV